MPRLLLLLLLALCAEPLLATAQADQRKFWLRITGSNFVHFEGECQLVDPRGFAMPTRLIGSVPQAFAIAAEAVACKIQNSGVDGTLVVELGQNDALIARGRTASSFGEIKVRSDGPWGNAGATVNVIPLVPHGHNLPPSTQQPGLPPPIVPPLSGQTVPPLH